MPQINELHISMPPGSKCLVHPLSSAQRDLPTSSPARLRHKTFLEPPVGKLSLLAFPKPFLSPMMLLPNNLYSGTLFNVDIISLSTGGVYHHLGTPLLTQPHVAQCIIHIQ